jgi:plastocyanin
MAQPRLFAVIALPAALVALAIAGCGSSSSTSTTSEGAATSTPASGGASGGGQTVKLSADPNGALKFNTSQLQAKAGMVTVEMSNPSSSGVQHGIAIEGHGVDQDGPIVQPGNTSTDTVNLKPGKYDYYCPFDSHEQQGMTGTLTVK